MSAAVAQPLAPSPALLPPTPRDFDIHRAYAIERISTRSLAQQHGLSQTRIRQLVHRVNNWLANALPVKTEAEWEREVRLAQNLAADQLNHQIDQLQQFWNGSSDPKYLRQQTRAILALARLGVIPGAIDPLAADAECGAGLRPAEKSEGEPPADPSASIAEPNSPQSPICNPQFEIDNSQSEFVPAPQLETWNSKLETACCPPPGACSPSSSSPPLPVSPSPPLSAVTPSTTSTSAHQLALMQDDIDGLNLLEQRLLTLLAELPPTDSEKRSSLEQSLFKIRNEQASLQIRLSPNLSGASLDFPADALTPTMPQPALQPTEN